MKASARKNSERSVLQKISFAAAYCRGNLKIMRTIYLDHAATTPLSAEALQAMMLYLTTSYGNADSRYALGRNAASAVLSARDEVRSVIGAGGNVYFTSCGSEANSWALKGVCAANFGKKNTIVLSAIEHPSLLRAAEDMAVFGFETVLVNPDSSGIVRPQFIQKAIEGRQVAFVGVMRANNETGVIQPAEEIHKVCKDAGVFYFCDCVQAAGAMPFSADLAEGISISAHKFYGPKGVGALWLKKGARIQRLVSGGQQESGLRGGTSNVAGIVGMGCALKAACRDMTANNQKIAAVRNAFVKKVLGGVSGAFLVGDDKNRLPSNANIAFPSCRGEQIMIKLDMRGVAVSTGSACSSGASKPSKVLLAMGLEESVAASCVRFSFGAENTEEEALFAAEEVISAAREVAAEGRI